jgi:hypothetical protein
VDHIAWGERDLLQWLPNLLVVDEQVHVGLGLPHFVDDATPDAWKNAIEAVQQKGHAPRLHDHLASPPGVRPQDRRDVHEDSMARNPRGGNRSVASHHSITADGVLIL